MESHESAVQGNVGIDSAGPAVLQRFRLQSEIVKFIRLKIQRKEFGNTAKNAENGGRGRTHAAADGDVGFQMNSDAPLQGELQAVDHGDDEEMEQIEGFGEHAFDGKLAA